MVGPAFEADEAAKGEVGGTWQEGCGTDIGVFNRPYPGQIKYLPKSLNALQYTHNKTQQNCILLKQ